MKKIITTVGTSIFNNYLVEFDDIKNHYTSIEKMRHSKWNECKDRVEKIRKPVTEWAKENQEASAEIKTILKLYQSVKENLDVYLLATDTVTSRLASEIIKDIFSDIEGIKIFFNPDQYVIYGLQVENYDEFVKTGIHDFIRRVNSIAGGFFTNVVFNITGGYKGLIPFMTIMAQANNCDMVYIFEESDNLIEIPKTPITIDYQLFEKRFKEIAVLEEGIEDYKEAKQRNYEVFSELESKGIVEIMDNWAFLSPIGTIFFESFKSQHCFFYCPNDVWEEIQVQKDIKRILKEKFFNENIRNSKTEIKQNHKVFDDGDNNNRIYYFEENSCLYIYKTFEDEEAAQKFISTKLDKGKIINNSVLRRL